MVVPAPFSQQAQLEQIRNSIQQQGSINAASVGSKLALQVDLAFHSGNVSVGYINATLTDTSLVGAPSRALFLLRPFFRHFIRPVGVKPAIIGF